MSDLKQAILEGKTALGIELGSTRIKAVLIGADHSPIASGAFDWENRLENGVWTYHLDDVWEGIQAAYRALREEVKTRYGTALKRPGAMGVSGMMHGYLPFDAEGNQLAEFRTWRNTLTEREAAEARAADRMYAFLCIEGMSAIPDMEGIDCLADFGVRIAMLTWNEQNQFASGAKQDPSQGLTALGREAVL